MKYLFTPCTQKISDLNYTRPITILHFVSSKPSQRFWIFYLKYSVFFFQETQEEWRSVFFLSSALLLASALTFVLFAEDGIADWAKEPHETSKVAREIPEYVTDKKCDECNSMIDDKIVKKF